MRAPMCALCVRIDVGTLIVRHPFPSGKNFRLAVPPLPEPLASHAAHALAETREFLARFSADAPPWARVTRFRLSARPSLNIYYPPGTNFSLLFPAFTQGLDLLFFQGVLTFEFCELPL